LLRFEFFATSTTSGSSFTASPTIEKRLIQATRQARPGPRPTSPLPQRSTKVVRGDLCARSCHGRLIKLLNARQEIVHGFPTGNLALKDFFRDRNRTGTGKLRNVTHLQVNPSCLSLLRLENKSNPDTAMRRNEPGFLTRKLIVLGRYRLSFLEGRCRNRRRISQVVDLNTIVVVTFPNRTIRRLPVDIDRIVSELKSERDRIGRVIALLAGGVAGLVSAKIGRTSKRGGRGSALTPVGRKRLSEAMKRRWAERKRKAGLSQGAGSSRPRRAIKAAAKQRRGGLTPEGRKRLSDMMKKRWAERRKKLP
jgi:hypothetical protein